MNELQLEERETHFTMTGDNHTQWVIFTDDPYWSRSGISLHRHSVSDAPVRCPSAR